MPFHDQTNLLAPPVSVNPQIPVRGLRELISRFGGLFNKRRKDRELDDEIESHLQLHIEDNLRLGMTSEEARREAMLKLGGIESTKEAYRDQRGLPILEALWRAVRYGGRQSHSWDDQFPPPVTPN